jgi:hypothetical protein
VLVERLTFLGHVFCDAFQLARLPLVELKLHVETLRTLTPAVQEDQIRKHGEKQKCENGDNG